MKKKYFKPILLSLCIIFLFGITAFATNLNISNELNW